MTAELVWLFLGLGVVAYLGARRDLWSYVLSDLCWWGSVWVVTDNDFIRYGWGAIVMLNVMTRSDFPWRYLNRGDWSEVLVRTIRCVVLEAGDSWYHFKRYVSTFKLFGHYEWELEELGLDRVFRKYSLLLSQRLIPGLFAAALSIIMAAVVAWNESNGNSDAVIYLVAAACTFAITSAVIAFIENWKNYTSLRSGIRELSKLTPSEQASLLHYCELIYSRRNKLFPLHMTILFCAGCGYESAVWVSMSTVLFFSAFEKPLYTEYFRVHVSSLWSRNLKFLSASSVERVLGTKLEIFNAIFFAWLLGQPALLFFSHAMELWEHFKSFLLRFSRGSQIKPERPQMVCCALDLYGFSWNWLDEKVLFNKVEQMEWAWLYHDYYLDPKGNKTAMELLHASDGAIIAGRVDKTSGDWFRSVVDFVQVPFRHLGVLAVREANSEMCGAEHSLEYYCSVIDEPIFQQEETPLGELVELEPLNLNRRVKGWLRELGLDFEDFKGIYEGGIMELNILHRRVHEFSQPATRFLEILNIWELVARWALVLKQDEGIENEQERLSIPFGVVFDLVRKEPLMKEKLRFPPELMDIIRKFWKDVFNWSASMSSHPTVAEVFTWFIYIRNKTRGHGSTSRIHFQLYAAVEVMTLLLFQGVKRHMDLELLVMDEGAPLGVGTIRRGMRLEFLEEGDANIGSLPQSSGGVYFRHAGSEGPWQSSNLLKVVNGHVFILNDMKKGHREWVCFSTGELIRPEVIFDH